MSLKLLMNKNERTKRNKEFIYRKKYFVDEYIRYAVLMYNYYYRKFLSKILLSKITLNLA